MNKSILAITMALSFSAAASASLNVAGDDLAFFDGQREAVQKGAIVIDVSDQGQHELASIMAKQPLGEFSPEVLKAAERAVENNRKIAPKYVAMMEEAAQLRGIPVAEVFASVSQVDYSVNQAIKASMSASEDVDTMKGCTSVAFNNGIVGQTNDLSLASSLTDHTTVVKTEDSIFVIADGAHFQGMGKNVGIVINFMGQPAGVEGIDNDELVTVDAVFAAATAAKSVEAFIDTIKDVKTIIPFNFTVADNNGGHAAIEITVENGLNVTQYSERGSVHANHSADFKESFLKTNTALEANTAFFSTFAREEAAANFLDYSPELTVESMQWLFSQRPINMTKYNGKDFVTVEAMIFDTVEGCAYVAGDNPNFAGYSQVCFD
ncbi:carcinine hydrolase/isopenicillin-N N-acyltransferase family protein [Vibrio tapetis subsp. quintayensis]|uniref:carcinine hydrolase/isopenicillin-N N-acyltransferase family protein n=1 Tax=Vibrio tapetis TaxID=52443 RepID=UPI0025B49495|nr:carcinine hydrolase/isopenicillin-N N-acyltransferase family protein [Vibrio tapetis]MDN3680979.1 carcinine hydrolase/isopenicillin-N N-acyltransferase family protein [Vibrio tapetis subsp. quintayensis]